MQANWWQLSASGSAFDFRGCWADVRGSQKSSVHNIVDLASHMFVGDVMPSRLVSISHFPTSGFNGFLLFLATFGPVRHIRFHFRREKAC
ncbi:hypothetical protein T05_3386 [Trichinella murrelli]|uniref:Uncharacterized protein n=1 Tax=Trichinella murrelli TaxID=144512 RepID=A0A0V0UDD7_9BILA|nr:hypothetical protein T05_3386 [Trichinella murrelli]